MNIKLENNDKMLLPTLGSSGAGGYDLRSNEDVVVSYGQIVKVSTGISLEIPEGYIGNICPRSSIFSKGIICSGNNGIIDSDYRGIIKVAVQNLQPDHSDFIIHKYDRIAQLVFIEISYATFSIVDNLSLTDRGAGGFGSTGTN